MCGYIYFVVSVDKTHTQFFGKTIAQCAFNFVRWESPSEFAFQRGDRIVIAAALYDCCFQHGVVVQQ